MKYDEFGGSAVSRKAMLCAGEDGMLLKRKGSSWMKRCLGPQKNVWTLRNSLWIIRRLGGARNQLLWLCI